MFEYLLVSLYNLFFDSYSLIIPNLWLGDINAAHNIDFLKENKIDVIVNCTKGYPFIYEINDEAKELKLETYRIPVEDSLLEKDFIIMEQWFDILLPIILQHYKENKRILIHCFAGKQRSAIFVAALLKTILDNNCGLKIENLEKNQDITQEYKDIINFILSKRYHAFTYGFRINFEKSYKRYFKIK
jgi:protein-tyrosine phosphatase